MLITRTNTASFGYGDPYVVELPARSLSLNRLDSFNTTTPAALFAQGYETRLVLLPDNSEQAAQLTHPAKDTQNHEAAPHSSVNLATQSYRLNLRPNDSIGRYLDIEV